MVGAGVVSRTENRCRPGCASLFPGSLQCDCAKRDALAQSPRRARELDASVKRISASLIPHEPMDWELRQRQDEALKRQITELQVENANLNQMLDDAQDTIGDLRKKLARCKGKKA